MTPYYWAGYLGHHQLLDDSQFIWSWSNYLNETDQAKIGHSPGLLAVTVQQRISSSFSDSDAETARAGHQDNVGDKCKILRGMMSEWCANTWLLWLLVCSLTKARLSPPSHHPSFTCPQWRGQSWPPAWPGQTQPFCSHLNCALIDSQFLFLPNCFCVLILLRYSLPTVLPTARAQGWTSHLAGNVSFSVLLITIII